MKIVFLGTSGGFPSKERNVASWGLKMDGEIVLFDCGEGTQRQLLSSSLSYMKIQRIFITHFHGDHFLGIAGLIQTMCLNNRTKPLEIHGPKGTVNFMKLFLKLGFFNQTMPVFLHELESGEVRDFTKFKIQVMEVDHDIPALAYSIIEPNRAGKFDPEKAMRIGMRPGPDFRKLQSGESIEYNGKTVDPEMVIGPERRGRRIVYTGDTRPVEGLVEFSRGADVLIHDATFHSELVDKSMEFGHSTALQAAELAKKAGVGLLFLTHISNRYSKDPTPLLEEARRVFPNTELARDFLEYDVPLRE